MPNRPDIVDHTNDEHKISIGFRVVFHFSFSSAPPCRLRIRGRSRWSVTLFGLESNFVERLTYVLHQCTK